MLARHSALYFLARGAPGLVNLAALKVYTTMLSPAEFGRYALALALVMLANTVCFQWIKLSVLRMFPSYQGETPRFYATIAAAFLLAALFTGALGWSLIATVGDGVREVEIWYLAIVHLWALALYEIHLDFARIRLRPLIYGLMALARAFLGLALASFFLMLGLGAEGLMLGLILGICFAIGPATVATLRDSGIGAIDRDLLKRAALYGAPLAGAAIAERVIALSDRFVIDYFMDDAAVGRYAAVYDLAQYMLVLLISVVNVAGYPLVVRAFEREGMEAARKQLGAHLAMLAAVALPSCFGFALLAAEIADTFLGAAFREGAAPIAAVIAGSVLLSCLRSFYLDLGFQLSHRTIGQFWIHTTSAIANLILNVALIPIFGLIGAAWATFFSYGLAALLAAIFAPRYFPLPPPGRPVIEIAGAALLMVMAVLLVERSWDPGLFGAAAIGALVYGGALMALDTGGARRFLLDFLADKLKPSSAAKLEKRRG